MTFLPAHPMLSVLWARTVLVSFFYLQHTTCATHHPTPPATFATTHTPALAFYCPTPAPPHTLSHLPTLLPSLVCTLFHSCCPTRPGMAAFLPPFPGPLGGLGHASACLQTGLHRDFSVCFLLPLPFPLMPVYYFWGRMRCFLPTCLPATLLPAFLPLFLIFKNSSFSFALSVLCSMLFGWLEFCWVLCLFWQLAAVPACCSSSSTPPIPCFLLHLICMAHLFGMVCPSQQHAMACHAPCQKA